MSTFTVMTWNVQNLFLPSHDGGPDDEATFQRKLDSLAAVIDQEQPHVLALQEVGPDGALEQLQAALTHAMPHAAVGVPDPRGIRVAFLSTEPFQSTQNLLTFPDGLHPVQAKDKAFDKSNTPEDESLTKTMGRGGLEVRVSIGGTPVTIINAHFKSKLISYARQRGVVSGSQFQPNDEGERYRYAAYALFKRTGEAVTIRERLNEVLAGGGGQNTAVVFCGDLNDEVEAATTQILQGPSGSEIGTTGFSRADQGDWFRMWNLAPLLSPVNGAPAFTRKYRGRGELIDHIFASQMLVNPDNLPTVRTVMSGDSLPNMEDDPNARRNEPGSDHAAVVATFDVQ